MKKHIIYWLALGLVMMIGCQKELSFEVGNSQSHGTLQSDLTGDCLPKTVNGIYTAATALVPATNTITVQVNVLTTGAYQVFTDTVNGYYFRATGIFTTPGINDVTLRSNGTPFAAGINNFVVTYDSTTCDIAVTVLPAGAGAAVFTLAGAPAACTGATVAGGYALGVALNASNTATISVNVTTPGTYNISTTATGGMTFSATGTFAATGVQTVVLAGAGTPTVVGANTIPVTAGTSSCNFVVTVTNAAVGTLSGGPGACTIATVSGTYTVGTAMTASNTVQVQINVTTPGTFSITTNTVTGFSFSGSGTATLGTQTLAFIATGTPTTAGVQTFTITFGTSTCTFPVTVTGPAGAAGTLGGGPGACTPSTVSGIYVLGVPTNNSNTVQIQAIVTALGAYTISTNTVTGVSFAATGTFATLGAQNVTLVASGSPTTAGPQTFTVTWGTSTCTFTVNVLTDDYFPRTTNSNWSYEFNDDALDSTLRKVYPQTLSALGNVYNIFMANDGSGFDSSGYYRRSGGSYYEYFDFGTFVGYDNPVWGEYIMVKDDVAVGTNWKSNGFAGTSSGTPINLRLSYTILQKNVPVVIVHSLGTTSYQYVIVVEEKFEAELAPGVWTDVTSQLDFYGKSYYARGVGLIKFEAYNAANTMTDHQELRRFQIF